MTFEDKWPFPFSKRIPKFWAVKSKIVISVVGIASKIVMEWMNSVKVFNKHILYDSLDKRPKGRGLLTVSNHHSCVDDPVIFGTLTWRHLVTRNECVRWIGAASELCFFTRFYSWFFSMGRCVPINRGKGVYQRGMDFLLERLEQGDWVHVFPEGGVNVSHEPKRLKWGVGRLISECKELPVVIPLWHLGMDDILPNKRPYIPQIGKKVTVYIGEPMDFTELLELLRKNHSSPIEIRKLVTDHLQAEFRKLTDITTKLHNDHIDSRIKS